MILNAILGTLALLSLVLLLWQWLAAVRFPLHERVGDRSFAPAVTMLKSLKGCDGATEDCMRSWFAQDHAGEIQILFGVASSEDPVCEVVRKLMGEFPKRDAQLIVVESLIGANAKVSKLAELEKQAKHDILVVSDADVRVPADFLTNALVPFRDLGRAGSPIPAVRLATIDGAHGVTRPTSEVGLVNCFYRLANPSTPAMQWEAISINADFWSQVLQSKSLKPLDFALGAVMITRRKQLDEIGGFKALVDCLADDYQLGNRIARKGYRIELCPVVVECWDPPMGWRAVWKHQLRWARTIRVCQPVPYFFSILSNAGLWALMWLVWQIIWHWPIAHFNSSENEMDAMVMLPKCAIISTTCLVVRILAAFDLQRRLTRSTSHAGYFWLAPIKDVLQAAIWLGAFFGNRIEWRGQRFRLNKDGTLKKT